MGIHPGTIDEFSKEEADGWPYPPSWFDRFAAWLEKLPGPSALYFIALGIGLMLILFSLAEVGTSNEELFANPARIFLALIIPYMLAAAYYLDIRAGRAIEKLRPTLNFSEVSLEQMKYRITTLPASPALLASLIMVLVVHLPLLFGLNYLGFTPDLRDPGQLAVFLVGLIFWWVFGFGLYHTVHQLRAVRQIYTEYVDVNLYRVRALHALSTVTSMTSIGIIVAASVALAVLPSIALRPIGLVVIATSVFLAVITFGWPLWGVHRLMVEEKERMDIECSKRYESLLIEWHLKVDSRKLDGSGDLHSAIQSALAEKGEISKIPTWPWAPGTLRGWIAALFLPLAVWMLQWLIERVLRGG